jgi:hypothetical protein
LTKTPATFVIETDNCGVAIVSDNPHRTLAPWELFRMIDIRRDKFVVRYETYFV